MAEEFEGLSQEQLNRLSEAKNNVEEIYEAYKNVNKQLRANDEFVVAINKSSFATSNIVKDIAKLQRDAVNSADAARKLEEKKN